MNPWVQVGDPIWFNFSSVDGMRVGVITHTNLGGWLRFVPNPETGSAYSVTRQEEGWLWWRTEEEARKAETLIALGCTRGSIAEQLGATP
jgi:hypothetical protein